MMRALEDVDGTVRILRSDDVRVSMWLPERGSGSHAELVDYVRTVLEQNCDLKPGYNPTGSFDKLSRGMVFSILHRLGIQWEEPSDPASAAGVDRADTGPGSDRTADPAGTVAER